MNLKRGALILGLVTLCCGGCSRISGFIDSIFGNVENASSVETTVAAGEQTAAISAEPEAIANKFFSEDVNIDIVYFPPVPMRWTLRLDGNSVVYTAPEKRVSELDTVNSEVRLTYTRRTKGQGAAVFTDNYVKEHHCQMKHAVGIGFYTAACPDSNSNVVVIGESNNMYVIEITGIYDRSVKALVEGYVQRIISGKRVFRDRDIGVLNEQ